jgi:glycosyltransferase involved in cell wall biosynthesis
MPYYGDERLLKEAVGSVIDQTTDDWRLTVIDDAYPDTGPGRWVAGLNHARIRYVRNSRNGGVSATFRQAVDLAAEDFLTIMGCDDRLLPDYTERALQKMRAAPGASYLQPGVEVINEQGLSSSPLADRVKSILRPRPSAEPLVGESVARSLLRGNWTYFPSIVWRTSSIREYSFDPHFDVVLDLHLQLQILAGGGRMLLDDRATFQYRRHSHSVSSVTARDGARFAEERALFAEWSDRFEGMGWSSAARAARLHLTSRINALTLLPGARDNAALRRELTHHAFGGQQTT